jgi:outer membrane receptor protein involved in Fe transport
MESIFTKLRILCLLIVSPLAAATGMVRGVVHDPHHRPRPGAQVVLQSRDSTWTKSMLSDANGGFQMNDVPEGAYTITAAAQGLLSLERQITVTAGKARVLHVQLEPATTIAAIEASVAASKLTTQTSTVQTVVSSREIAETAGADQTNSLAMIADFTPGAYLVHDMLFMRGSHQVNWFFDGIPVVNTNVATSVAPLIDPKNVEELEIERGGYSSQYGDGTYGFFNVVTPSGFERDNEAEVILSGGNFHSTDDQFNIGGHTERFAYYASVDGNRSDLGLATPVAQISHDQSSGAGGFLSLLYNPGATDQFRWIGLFREDHYQIPDAPGLQGAASGDLDLEEDYFGGFHWTHRFGDGVLFTLSPYFHYNSGRYVGGQQDVPFVLDDDARAKYFGAHSVVQVQKKKHNARAGIEVWGQHESASLGLTRYPGASVLNQQERHWANSDALFLEDQYKATSWLTLDLGIRLTHYQGLVNENAADPRLGAAIRIPRLKWILHGYYAYYYQPPPLESLAGPAIQFAVSQGAGFLPLAGERDIQHDVGLSIPVRGWSLGVDNFHTSARNFLDSGAIGNSGILIPLTDLAAIVSGTEVALRSPRLFHRAQWRLAYSNQIAQGIGPVTGGLLGFAPAGSFLLDQDQRNTVTSVLSLSLPGNLWATPAYQFGSGFLNGDGPSHLAPHATFDVSIGKHFREKWTVSASVENIGNTRYLLDTSNTFGGTHFINPRQIYGELRYRFHF